jgi:Histidine kinase
MTLDPALPVLGDPVSGDPMSGDDVSSARATVARQWRDRRALERRLHDGAALRISALSLRLGLLRHALARGDEEFDAAVEALQDELHLVLQELRDVEGRLYPPLLDEAGLGPALREAAARCPVLVRIDATDERFGPAAEGAAYFALLDCLPQPRGYPDGEPDGAVDGRGDGHAPGEPVDVVVRRDGDVLVLLVTGVAACHAASVHDGVRLLGGTVVVGTSGSTGAAGAPITVRIPCA